MNETVERFLNIVAVALVLGLLLRYWQPATELIAQSGSTFVSGFRAISLQDA